MELLGHLDGKRIGFRELAKLIRNRMQGLNVSRPRTLALFQSANFASETTAV
ncbi:MAG: hypothetical protein WCA45_05265 [Thiobacillaceae bacterium]